MPELPEVEIVRQSLNKKIKEKKVKKVIVRNRNLRIKVPLNFENYLKNQKVIKVDRFSKYLILHLSNNSYCLFHLGMSGTIHLEHKFKKKLFTNSSFYNSPFLPKKHARSSMTSLLLPALSTHRSVHPNPWRQCCQHRHQALHGHPRDRVCAV